MKRILTMAAIALLAACGGPYKTTNKVYKKQAKQFGKQISQYPLKDSFATEPFVGTTNMSMRKANFVLIHHTAQDSTGQTLRTFTLPRTAVSAHYVIGDDGKVYHMVNDYIRAQHAGVGRWGNLTDLNSASIGIELDNNGSEPFSEAQVQSLLSVLKYLKKAFSIPTANFIGHQDWAPTRKNDPNWRFPWKRLAAEGYGLWWPDTTGVQVPQPFYKNDALRIIGYSVADSTAALRAFKRHFMQDTNPDYTPETEKILYSLYTLFRRL